MKDIKLSICIATLNRAMFIGETLNSIVSQVTDEVEIVIVDGASTDNTEEVVRQYQQRFPRLNYVRLAVKGGVDQDYCKAVELARGEFCWLFTDDDILKPEAIAAVIEAIERGYDLVVVNAEIRDRSVSTILEQQRIVMQENQVYAPSNMECLFVDALSYLSFIGAVVIRRSIWLSRERESYFGTEFVHVGVIFQKPLSEPALIIAEPYIIIRFGNAQWSSRRFDIWMFKWPKLVWSFEAISNEAKLSITRREPWRNLRDLILCRSLGNYDIQTYRQYFSTMQVGILWRMCAWLIAWFPRNIVVGFHYFYSRIKGSESRLFFDNRFSRS